MDASTNSRGRLSVQRHLHVLLEKMTEDIIVTAVAYVVTVASFLGWIFIRKPERVPRTRKTTFALCLRSLPLFLVFFLICRSFHVTAVFGFVVLAAIGFFTLTSFSLAGLPGLALFYALQQWILGWPDRALLVNEAALESNQSRSRKPDPFVGQSAHTTTPLRPTGKVVVAGKEVDASCEFGFLQPGIEVEIVGRRSFTILVKPKDGEAEQAESTVPVKAAPSASSTVR